MTDRGFNHGSRRKSCRQGSPNYGSQSRHWIRNRKSNWARSGITVLVAARSLKTAEETASQLKSLGIDALPIQLDVTNPADRASRSQVHR